MSIRGCFLIILWHSATWVNVLGLLEVFTDCPPDHSPGSKAVVRVVSDEKTWEAFGFCEPSSINAFGDFEFIKMPDTVTRYLDVYFSAEGDESKCVFMEHPSREDVFQVSIEAYLPFRDYSRTVTCMYQDHLPTEPPVDTETQNITSNFTFYNKTGGFYGTDELELKDPAGIQAQGIFLSKGGPAKSNLALYLADIKNQPVGNRKWRFGRYLKLAAELVKPVGNEISFQLHDCMAKSLGRNRTYQLLHYGCGDGVIISSDKGFTTTGKLAYSPPFKAFHLLHSTRVIFLCSFHTCHVNCDGSSCDPSFNARQVRDVGDLATKNDSESESGRITLTPKAGVGRRIISHTQLILDSEADDQKDGGVEEDSDSEADIYIGIGFVLSLISIVATISLIACRWLDTSGLSTQNSEVFR